jgi:RimJ/RimL family protein N-acetyltransferase
MEPGAVCRRYRIESVGEVTLRSIAPADAERVMAYANALIAEDTCILLSGAPKTLEEERRYVDEAVVALTDNRKITLVVEVDGTFAGLCGIEREPLRKSHVGTVHMSLAPQYRGKGIGRECLTTLIRMAKDCGFRLLTLTAFASNDRALHLYERVGFKRAGVIPASLQYRGQYIDEVVMYRELI